MKNSWEKIKNKGSFFLVSRRFIKTIWILFTMCRATVGDARVNVPTAFAENSPTCPTNDEGEPILPNGLAWRRFILIYLAAIKVLREADNELQATSKKQENQAMSQLSMLLQAQRGVKLPPLPFLITNMIKHAGVSPLWYSTKEQYFKGSFSVGFKDVSQ